MNERIVDNEIKLIPYYRNDEASLPWYQDLDVCRQVDNRDKPYDIALLHGMYDYLCAHGECYYIEYKGLKEVKANIYAFNTQSQKMFQSVGFKRTEEEWYCYHIVED